MCELKFDRIRDRLFQIRESVELIEEKLRQQKETVVAKQQELKRIERKIRFAE